MSPQYAETFEANDVLAEYQYLAGMRIVGLRLGNGIEGSFKYSRL